MYKSENAGHPWRRISEHALFEKREKTLRRDLKIGQLMIALVAVIISASVIGGGILSVYLPDFLSLPHLGKMLDNINQKQIIWGCMVVLVQMVFLFIGSKFAYRLLVWTVVPLTLLGIAAVAYFFFTPETRLLSLILAVMIGPYLLCSGILLLSWRAKLYLAYMNRDL